MIYSKQDQVYYLVDQLNNGPFYDMYSFSLMNHNANAFKGLIDISIKQLGLQKHIPQHTDRYRLVLDFLSNMRTNNISTVIDNVNSYFSDHEFHAENTEEPLCLSVSSLRIEDVTALIDDNQFQTINAVVATTNCSVWRLYRI